MYKKLFLLFLLLGSYPLFAQDLVNVYEIALQEDAELRIAESNYLSATAALPLAVSIRRPQINLTAEAGTRDTDSSLTGFTSAAGDNTTDSYGFSLNLTQNIYNAETMAQVSVAEAQVARALADLEASRQDLILRVAVAYFTILASEDNLEFAVAERTSIARQLEQAQKRFEVGLIAITDVHEAQARYDTSVAQELLAETLRENAIQALQVIIGQAPSRNLAQLGDKLELIIPAPSNSSDWVDIALQNNRGLISSLAGLKAAEYNRERAGGSDNPTVDFNASYSDTELDDDNLGDYDQSDINLSIQLNLPLFTGGRISAEKEQAESEYQSARNATLLQRRLASQQTRDAYLGVVSGISQVKAFRQALSSSNIALQATEAGFEVGTRTSVDVLISLRETFAAQRDYARARYDYLLNILKLKQAAGLLNIDDLDEINRWLTQ